MPQTSTDWAFWAFSTILVGFLLNVAAGLAANPISKALARSQSRRSVPVRPSQERIVSGELFPDAQEAPGSSRFVQVSLQPSVPSTDPPHESLQEPLPSALSIAIDDFLTEVTPRTADRGQEEVENDGYSERDRDDRDWKRRRQSTLSLIDQEY